MKKELRMQILKLRDTLTQQEIEEKSNAILQHLRELDSYKNANKVMLFLSFKTEVNTFGIIDDLFKQGKEVYIPVTVPKTKELIVSRLLDLDNDLLIGNFGVLEPKAEAIRPLPPKELDLVLVPGVVFDERGYRIGYGGGYYDRFLPKISPKIPTIALGYELQIIDRVPNESFDYPVKHILTEKRMIDCK